MMTESLRAVLTPDTLRDHSLTWKIVEEMNLGDMVDWNELTHRHADAWDAALARLEAAEEKLAEATWLLQHSEDEDEEGLIRVQWLDRRRKWLSALAPEETPNDTLDAGPGQKSPAGQNG